MSSAEKYVAAAYLVVFVGVLAWVAIIGTKLARLQREVTKLKAERDILKKAAAYFAKEST